MTKKNECCVHCRYFERSNKECRKNVPVVVLLWSTETRSNVPRTRWPIVEANAWCGEFAVK